MVERKGVSKVSEKVCRSKLTTVDFLRRIAYVVPDKTRYKEWAGQGRRVH